jgi:hypothetical protein
VPSSSGALLSSTFRIEPSKVMNIMLTSPKTADELLEDKAALVLSDQWRDCTKQQMIFLTEYLFGADPGNTLAATTVAYPEASKESQKCMQYQVIRAQAVVAVLEFWKWRDERGCLLEIAKVQLKAAEPGSNAAQGFAAQIERLTVGIKSGRRTAAEPTPPAEAEPQIPKGSTALRDADGILKGYKTADDEYVQLPSIVEVSGD